MVLPEQNEARSWAGEVTPRRVQMKRWDTGWRLPPNTMMVWRYRGSKFGNPFRVTKELPAYEAVRMFEEWLLRGLPPDEVMPPHDIPWKIDRTLAWLHAPRLRGKNVACWCGLDAPCHGDVWLREVGKMPRDDDECAEYIKGMIGEDCDFRNLRRGYFYVRDRSARKGR